MTKKTKVIIGSAVLATVLLYVGCYAFFRVAGLYQWLDIGMTRNYGPHDPRLKGVYEYDLITQTTPGWGFVHDLKPCFRLVSSIEYRMFIKGRPKITSEGIGASRAKPSR
jgi:hypothetical protein